jgi:hypothetical protein
MSSKPGAGQISIFYEIRDAKKAYADGYNCPRECVDHIVVVGETHLRRILREYARYYNTARTHRSLDQDAPVSRPVQQIGRIVSHALVGGLHHQYVRI